jgi:hypothetical protein
MVNVPVAIERESVLPDIKFDIIKEIKIGKDYNKFSFSPRIISEDKLKIKEEQIGLNKIIIKDINKFKDIQKDMSKSKSEVVPRIKQIQKIETKVDEKLRVEQIKKLRNSEKVMTRNIELKFKEPRPPKIKEPKIKIRLGDNNLFKKRLTQKQIGKKHKQLNISKKSNSQPKASIRKSKTNLKG